VDLQAQYKKIKKEIDIAIQAVVDEAAFYKGRYVGEFEERFAEFIGVKYCIGVANCTDALEIALGACRINLLKDSEVITTAHSFIATSEAITAAAAKIVFVDIDEKTYNLDVEKIEEKITSKTKVLLPVHLYGRAIAMDKISYVAEKYNLFVVEDCAQACGAEWGEKKVGSFGDVGCFSFYPSKNLGAYGDAGAVVTNDKRIADFVRKIANHGGLRKYEHKLEGRSSRLDGLQAAILNVKLNYIEEWNKKRYDNACIYKHYLKDESRIILPEIPEFGEHVFHLFVIRIKDRDRIRLILGKKGIETGIHYPIILPNLEAYDYLEHTLGDFSVANKIQDEILSLPMYPELTEKQIEYICETLKEVL